MHNKIIFVSSFEADRGKLRFCSKVLLISSTKFKEFEDRLLEKLGASFRMTDVVNGEK